MATDTAAAVSFAEASRAAERMAMLPRRLQILAETLPRELISFEFDDAAKELRNCLNLWRRFAPTANPNELPAHFEAAALARDCYASMMMLDRWQEDEVRAARLGDRDWPEFQQGAFLPYVAGRRNDRTTNDDDLKALAAAIEKWPIGDPLPMAQRILDERLGGSSLPELPIQTKRSAAGRTKRRADGKAYPTRTQDEVNRLIAGFKTENASALSNLIERVERGDERAKGEATRLFGRNKLAETLQIRSATQVGNSPDWQQMADLLGLRKSKQAAASHEKIGLDIALEKQADAERGSTVVDEASDRELAVAKREIRRLISGAYADAIIADLDAGKTTIAEALEIARIKPKLGR